MSMKVLKGKGWTSMRIQIETDEVTMQAELGNNDTAQKIYAALPIEGKVNRWGEEIYFSIPVDLAEASDARQEMAVGELGYWPPGTAVCIFFGPTPASRDQTPRAASNVNPFGMVDGDATVFTSVRNGETIKLSALED
jgi:hypothetical protein